MRSFQIVEDKTSEADFFLEKIESISIGNIDESRFYFSAFISAARSITFTLQAALKGHAGFDHWYGRFQKSLKENSLCRFFHVARNENQKQGIYHIVGGGISSFGEPKFYFDPSDSSSPMDDVVTASNYYFCTLLNGLVECYRDFGATIDPSVYYTLAEMNARDESIEDLEEQLLGIRGWTDIEGASAEDRLALLLRDVPMPDIDYVFHKRLGSDRFGNRTF